MELIAKLSPDIPQASTQFILGIRKGWRILLLSLAVLILYLPVLEDLIRKWWGDPNYSHGFLVPAFTGYLIWRKRKQLAGSPLYPSALGAACVLVSLGLLFLGRLGAEYFLQRISLWGMIVGLLLYFLGWVRLRTILFPLVFLLFMIPPPTIIYNELVFPLQLLASHLATGCLQATNLVPVVGQGNLLLLPNSTLEIAEACSGIRSLFALLAFSLGYGYLMESSRMIRGILFLAAIPAAIVGNAARLIITASLVYYFGPRMAEGISHTLSNNVVLVTTVLLLVFVHTTLVWTQRQTLFRASR